MPEMHKLEDLLKTSLSVVFCGTGAGTKSAREGQYYAHGGNKFWRILEDVGFTPTRIAPKDYRTLLDYGIGLTDLVKDHAGMDDKISKTAWPLARDRLKSLIATFQPRYLAFTSVKASEVYFGKKRTLGLQPETIGQTKIWVLSSTSPANAHWNGKTWYDLRQAITNTH